MKNLIVLLSLVLFIFSFIFISQYGYGSGKLIIQNDAQQSPEKDKGIGPFKDVKLNPVDKEKAKQGMTLFKAKCTSCHELDKKLVGPPLRNVTKEQTPEFILNAIVNPAGMQKSNAQIKKLLKQYNNVPMTDQKITQPQALELLDYLRSVAK
jgi:cytochrome c